MTVAPDRQSDLTLANPADHTGLGFDQPRPADEILESKFQVPNELKGHAMVVSLDSLVGWARSNSLWPLTFGLACCAIEMISVVGSPRTDAARFGAEVFRASPRQADMLILSGRVSIKMAPVIRRIYDQMLEPKWVISMGACASSAGMFNNYALVQGADKFLPVDVYVPGCPPRPEAVLYGVIKLQNKIKGQPDQGWRERYQAWGTEEQSA